MRALNQPALIAAGIIPAAFFLLFFYLPLFTALTFPMDGSLFQVLTAPTTLYALRFTLLQASLSALLSTAAALPGAYFLAHYRLPGRRIILSLSMVPFVAPPILVVLGFVLLFGRQGLLNSLLMEAFSLEAPPLSILYSLKAILLAHVFYNFPIALRLLTNAWRRVPASQKEASRLLGASFYRRLITVDLPFLKRSLFTSLLLVFLYCFMSFAVILVLGGGPRFSTLEVEVYRSARISLDPGESSILALLETSATLLFMTVYLLSSRRTLPGGDLQPLVPPRGTTGILILLYLLPAAFFLMGPLAAVVLRSFQGRFGWHGAIQWTLRWYREILAGQGTLAETVRPAFLRSLATAVRVLLISQPLALLTALFLNGRPPGKGGWEIFFLLPMGVSTIILSLGYTLRIEPSPATLALVHSLAVLPLSIRILAGSLGGMAPAYGEAASTLGASPLTRFRTITLPLLRPALAASAALAFAVSMGEFNAALMLAPPGYTTLPVALYRLIGSYRFFSACAVGMILILISGLAFYFINSGKEEFL